MKTYYETTLFFINKNNEIEQGLTCDLCDSAEESRKEGLYESTRSITLMGRKFSHMVTKKIYYYKGHFSNTELTEQEMKDLDYQDARRDECYSRD